MGLNNDIVKLCKIYRGETENPYQPQNLEGDAWAAEYLKFQIWDAERSVSEHPGFWLDDADGDPEEAYKAAVLCKLKKMGSDDGYNWIQMYFAL